MILGIKTTGGVSKLKTKTTDGVVKAVECACCDPCGGLWGPGYDDWPDMVYISGCNTPLLRVSSCVWALEVMPPEGYGDTTETVAWIQYEENPWKGTSGFMLYYFLESFAQLRPHVVCAPSSGHFSGSKMSDPYMPLGVYSDGLGSESYTVTS